MKEEASRVPSWRHRPSWESSAAQTEITHGSTGLRLTSSMVSQFRDPHSTRLHGPSRRRHGRVIEGGRTADSEAPLHVLNAAPCQTAGQLCCEIIRVNPGDSSAT